MDGWEVIGDYDTRIYRRETISANGSVLWSNQSLGAVDSSVNEVAVVNFIERLSDDDVVPFWHELYRICAHAADVRLVGAYWSSIDVQADVTRKRGLSERMIAHLSVPGRVSLRLDPLEDGIGVAPFDGVDFEPNKIVHIADPEWECRTNEAKNWALAHSINVVRRLEASLSVVKPCRIP